MKPDPHNASHRALTEHPAAVAAALGSGEPVRLTPMLTGGAGLSELATRLGLRLRSCGGRPTDPDWTTSRRVPFRSDVWEHVKQTANQISATNGYKVAPAQLCSQLIEDGLARLDAAAEDAFDRRERPPSPME